MEHRTVHELSPEELDELRWAYFCEHFAEEDFRYTSADEIPDEVIFVSFEGIAFVEDDFFCNLKND